MTQPHLILVGGFLGAGKTSLILAAARCVSQLGMRAAVILNDQSTGLVDTTMVRAQGFATDEVTGGCFCCRFADLIAASERLQAYNPEVIFAEPVGSCTDIAATTIRPLQSLYPQAFRIAPFTVLVDPARAAEFLAEQSESDIGYLCRKQLAEADVVCLTKSDLPAPDVSIPRARTVSAVSGQGVNEWLSELLSHVRVAGQNGLDLDYERYAKAEAALAWLNWSATVFLDSPLSPALLLGPLFDLIDYHLTAAGVAIVHLKATDECESGFLKAATCRSGVEPVVEGDMDASPAWRHALRVNLRAAGDPEIVRRAFEESVDSIPGTIADATFACFQPAPPKPQHRFTIPNLTRTT